MTDFNAIERNRWGGPSPWAGKDSRTDAQKRGDWRTGRPAKHGYYLAAWQTLAGMWMVSELWFNPQSTGTGWWASRGYLGDRTAGVQETLPVVAWMPMPVFDDVVAGILNG